MRPCLFLCFGFALLAGCARCGGTKSLAQVDAGDASNVSPSQPPVWDDLLHTTDARLAVSSKVDNPHDFPEHIADGRLDTAWNSKTGDLVGGWFGFRIPEAARVRAIDLTVGFDARSKKGEDLFSGNHRIARVRVRRNTEMLLEHTFDPDKRGFQRIRLDAAGGDYRIEVLEAKPGTHKDWRELTVSELRVLGIAGTASLHATVMPRVEVGGFDGPVAVPVPSSPVRDALEHAATIEALCDGFSRRARPDVERALREIERGARFGETPEVACSAMELAPRADADGGPVSPSAGSITLLLFSFADSFSVFSRLGVRYAGRTYAFGAAVHESELWNPCPHAAEKARVHEVRIEGGAVPVAVFTIYRWSKSYDEFEAAPEDAHGKPGPSTRELTEVRCALRPSGPSCQTSVIASRRGTESLDALDEVPALPW